MRALAVSLGGLVVLVLVGLWTLFAYGGNAQGVSPPTRSGVVISRHLDTVGDGSGTKNAIGNYSATATEFKIVPGATEDFTITRLLVCLRDSGALSAEKYGFISGGLTNGVILEKRNGSGTMVDYTDLVPIKANAGWTRMCHDVQEHSYGAGDNFISARWTFVKSGHPIRLSGAKGEYLAIILEDDLTGLVEHYFVVQGVAH